jgi:hypothetical protein
LQHDVAVLLDGVSNVGVQRKYLIAGYDPSVALNNEDIADRAALHAQLHFRLLVFRGESYVEETGKSIARAG